MIAQGGPGRYGLVADAEGSAATITVEASRSNYPNANGYGPNAHVTPAGSGENQPRRRPSATPAAGDYREAAGSPTIDAGADSGLNGTVDIDGDARTVGKTDIGADEFVTPPAGGPTPPGWWDPPSALCGCEAGVRPASASTAVTVRAVLSCPAGRPGGCTGTAKLTARRRVAGSRALSTCAWATLGWRSAPVSARR